MWVSPAIHIVDIDAYPMQAMHIFAMSFLWDYRDIPLYGNLHWIVDSDDGGQVEQFLGEQAGKNKLVLIATA